jgi:hypothetical protein
VVTREIHVYRADGEEAQPVVIRVEQPMPAIQYDLPVGEFTQRASARFASEGAALAEAIWSSCPGGTVDALIAALLTRRASLLRVAFPKERSR